MPLAALILLVIALASWVPGVAVIALGVLLFIGLAWIANQDD